MHVESTTPLAARFWSKVLRTDGCWPWIAHVHKWGYGQFTYTHGRTRLAHRVAWELTYGPIPDGLFVCHRCDNPACCRPDHLFLGTAADNMADRDRKGRVAVGGRNGRYTQPERTPRGDQHGARLHPERFATRFTVDQIRDIRSAAAAGATNTDPARRYGIGQSSISRIVNRKSWRHVP
jgi:HNH endonuclease